MGKDIIYGSCAEYLVWMQPQWKYRVALCLQPTSPVWWLGKTAQRRAAGLALSVPQVLHDWPWQPLRAIRGPSCLGAAIPSQQPGPWLRVAGTSPHSPGLLCAEHLVSWGLHLSLALWKRGKSVLGLRNGSGCKHTPLPPLLNETSPQLHPNNMGQQWRDMTQAWRGLWTTDLWLLLAVLCSPSWGNTVSKEIFKLHFLCLQVPVFQY